MTFFGLCCLPFLGGLHGGALAFLAGVLVVPPAAAGNAPPVRTAAMTVSVMNMFFAFIFLRINALSRESLSVESADTV